MTIAVIDYGMGNLHSVAKALEHVASEPVVITRDADTLHDASRIILPGQGAIRDCMHALEDTGLLPLVRTLLNNDRVPLLGICVGQQMLLTDSDENGGIACIDYIPGQVKRFPNGMIDEQGNVLKVPHMGWNEVATIRSHPLWEGIASGTRFYFVHSYYVDAADRHHVIATTRYGNVEAHVAVVKGSNVAVQFHPEKSSDAGLRLLHNFVNWQPEPL